MGNTCSRFSGAVSPAVSTHMSTHRGLRTESSRRRLHKRRLRDVLFVCLCDQGTVWKSQLGGRCPGSLLGAKAPSAAATGLVHCGMPHLWAREGCPSHSLQRSGNGATQRYGQLKANVKAGLYGFWLLPKETVFVPRTWRNNPSPVSPCTAARSHPPAPRRPEPRGPRR